MTEPSQIATVRRPRAAPAAQSRPQHRADHSAGWLAFAVMVGVASATLNALALLLFVPSYPFLALALFAVDLLVIYGLVAYGGRLRPAA